jgi:ribosome-binding protein aMBF1 (putative translation factor)
VPNRTAADLVIEARRRAGLSQRELARRARTVQSVVARIESGVTSPSLKTLSRLLTAAGFELRTRLDVRPIKNSHMIGDVTRILALTPEQRLRELGAAARLLAGAQRV